MTRKGESITLSISDRDKSQLEQLAFDLGFKWGDRPNISKLVEAIARRQVQTGLNNDWSSDRIRTLERTYHKLVDAGEIELAKAIATILSERSELARPLRKEIETFLERPLIPWRHTIDNLIRQQQPFCLNYQDAAEHLYTFSIYHAAITLHEKREYLDCWCEKIAVSSDIPELQHNRSLRLDRIPTETAITPIKAKWRSHLDLVLVEFHLFGNLAFAYRAKPIDTSVEWLPERSPPTLQVIRKVSNTFWFFREILPYAEDCEIISPQVVRDKFIEKLSALYGRYSD